MSKVNEALWSDYTKANELIESSEKGSNEYSNALVERDNIRNELIKLEQIKNEKDVKMSQIESEDKRERVRNAITIGTFTVSTIVSVCAISKTFKFDQVATVTSTLGRNILNGVVPKMLKR